MCPEAFTYEQEGLRKSTHFLALVIPAIYLILPHGWAVGLMIAANIFIIGFEIIRLRRWSPWRFLSIIFGQMIRPKEQNGNFTGAVYILLAGLFCILFFDKYVAATAMTFIIIGDVGSAMVGRRWGKHRLLGSKTLEGSLAFLVIALAATAAIPHVPWTVGILGALVATVAEALSIYRDDNLTVPLSAGLTMHLLIKLFPTWP